jgi:hypothetical protein
MMKHLVVCGVGVALLVGASTMASADMPRREFAKTSVTVNVNVPIFGGSTRMVKRDNGLHRGHCTKYRGKRKVHRPVRRRACGTRTVKKPQARPSSVYLRALGGKSR